MQKSDFGSKTQLPFYIVLICNAIILFMDIYCVFVFVSVLFLVIRFGCQSDRDTHAPIKTMQYGLLRFDIMHSLFPCLFHYLCIVSNNELVYPKCDIFDIVGMDNGNVVHSAAQKHKETSAQN